MNISRFSIGMAFMAVLSGAQAFAGDGGPDAFSPSPVFAFVENKGQFTSQDGYPASHVRYMLRLPGLSVMLRDHGFSYQLHKVKDALGTRAEEGAVPELEVARVDIDLVGHEAVADLRPSGILPHYHNYYIAQRKDARTEVAQEITHVPAYTSVVFRDAFPGVSIEFLVTAGEVPGFKYNIITEPGADLEQVKFRYTGAVPRLVDGRLQLHTATAQLEERIPRSWTAGDGGTRDVKVSYATDARDASIMGFRLEDGAAVPAGRKLVIDPTPIWYWGTYFGGGADTDEGNDVVSKTTIAGTEIYICGMTMSPNLATGGAHQFTIGGNYDGFLCKYDVAGTLGWATYYGGLNTDSGQSVDLDASGNVYLCGIAASTAGIATTTPGIHQSSLSGPGQDAFLAKFTPAGVRTWATYFGGPSSDQAFSVSTFGSDVFIGGYTSSTSNIATAGTHQTVMQGSRDLLVAKFSGANGSRTWATYYGGPATGSGHEDDGHISTGPDGHVYLCSRTLSTTGIATPGSYQPTKAAGLDAFVAKLNGSTGQRIWGTYYGGGGDDWARNIDVNCDSRVLVVGSTTSTTGIATAGTHQVTYGLNGDGFLANFSSTGALGWATYYGGDGFDVLYDVTAGGNGRIYIGGTTSTSTAGGTSIATPTASQPSYGLGSSDGFIASIRSVGTRSWGTYYGGPSSDAVYGLYCSGNRVFSTGRTSSASGISTLNSHPVTSIFSAFLGSHSADLTTECETSGSGLWLGQVKQAAMSDARTEVRVQPNPARGRATFLGAAWDDLRSLEVFDAQGRSCGLFPQGAARIVPVPGGIEADLGDLRPGLYTARIVRKDERAITVKLILEP